MCLTASIKDWGKAAWKYYLLDPRLVASVIACLFLFVDDVPRPFYATFHDPGAAVLLTIIFAQTMALAVLRLFDRKSVMLCLLALIAKSSFQGLFYVRNALILDLATLMAAHFVIGFAVRRIFRLKYSIMLLAVLVGCALALATCCMVSAFGGVFGYDGAFWELASARITFPYFFWSSLFVARYFALQRDDGLAVSCEPI